MMIRAPVMMIRDLAMTTPTPAMTIRALVVLWFSFLFLLHTTMNCFITMWISCLSWLVLFSILWNCVFLKLNLVTMILFRRKVSCISCHLYNLTKWFTLFLEIQRITKRDGLMKTYNTWAKLLQRQQLNQIQT